MTPYFQVQSSRLVLSRNLKHATDAIWADVYINSSNVDLCYILSHNYLSRPLFDNQFSRLVG